ncbi:MAG: hypothetical protein ABI650_08170 [Dokdonella sp.]
MGKPCDLLIAENPGDRIALNMPCIVAGVDFSETAQILRRSESALKCDRRKTRDSGQRSVAG